MSDVQKTAVALTTSDWHIRSTVPASRAELDWFEVMEKRLQQVFDLQSQLGDIPILICGDLFDRPNPHADLVKWFTDFIGRRTGNIYAIPGQHDLAGHQLDYRTRGAYGMACSLHMLDVKEPFLHVSPDNFVLELWPMPWESYAPPKAKTKADLRILMVHKYVYSTKDTAYVGVEESDAVTAITGWAKHADVIAIGDNHQSWRAGKFINHGSLFSTTSAQKDHEHLFGIVYSDGSLETIKLPEEKKWKDVYVPPEVASKADLLLAELSAAELDAVAFDELLDRLEGKLSDGARAELRALRS